MFCIGALTDERISSPSVRLVRCSEPPMMLPPVADGIGLPRGTALALNESVRRRA